ncbi:50S ribosomal protein L24e [Fusarium oxysporum f. sp. raphani 54005]|uniref:50S ribosomal protein L24e n=7 Tax=Fusarium oxysporum TaxID=5507 RepID=X0DDQ7_FUSOX|nr:50S ribosomal protein L24e [Fusarium oxysporum f. sp. lycopersici 4287]EXA49335.1 50S ribosomal protein L24e [Fusarium oxysporum f. sp. pisi HDV247]EXK41417.1 50S ribosomal protein L24e [Fusarium oxysporum f. sp. melonis 26406]EXL01230.1 50S ribosomal protein L24e [Fusarium oxysporum f. sp. raphani 54005]EXL85436.1 50S ribosomal protein L24e [Fusarium oxysporum f. sp. conglutinans race 2 54008]EXM37223.1 50S ribosomal protein L24e [Fusarium oxysporum f. sp. vasinfectum 25433]KAI8415420.1 h
MPESFASVAANATRTYVYNAQLTKDLAADTLLQFKMKRNPRKLKWTKAFRKAAGKEMTVDSTLQFAARRNVPVRYDRDLMAKTLKAMERVSEIRQRRERVFYKKRMAGKRERELTLARKLVAENEHLLPRMRGSEKKRLRDLGMTEEEIEEMEPDREKTKAFGGEKKKVAIALEVDEDDDEDEEGDSGMFDDEDDEDEDGDEDDEMDDIDMDAD